ncbi:MAG: hypothetical protein AB7H93_23480 [Vicinamibacterales bacterium]
MTRRHMSAAWHCDPGDPARKLVLLALADIADDRGIARPVPAVLAHVTNLTPAARDTALDGLEANRLIERVGRYALGPRKWRLRLPEPRA